MGRACAGACATCEVSYVQGAAMGARFNVRGAWPRFNVRGLKRCLKAGALCSAVTRGAWGALVRREPGQGDVAGGGALGSWCMRGWAKQALSQALSRRSLNSRTKPQPPCNAPNPQGRVVTLLPRPRPLTSEGCAGKGVGRLSPCITSNHNVQAPAERVRERRYHEVLRQSVITRSAWQQIGISPTSTEVRVRRPVFSSCRVTQRELRSNSACLQQGPTCP